VINNQNVAAQTPTNPTMNNQPLNQNVNNPANNQPKPSFTPMNNVQKPIVNNPTQNNFNSNKPMYNGNNFDKPISPRPDFKPSTNMDKPLQPKPNFMPKPEAEVPVAENPVTENPITENPVTEKPIVEKPIVEAQTDQDEFINTFLKARGSDISIEEVKSNDIKTNIEKAFFHPDAKQDMSTAITMITKGTEIIGTVSSTNSIVIGGAIKGDVDSTLNMTITGRVEGNIKCKIADLNDCDIIGDVTVAEHVRITEKTKIDGNIKTNSIEIDGKVKGNIISTASVHIMRNALVIGDIVTSRLSIEEGAMVQGNISMKIN
ncbi:MAG: polymer-forming cytoskeletal protein, partial [Oscillospiraceae bacterium]